MSSLSLIYLSSIIFFSVFVNSSEFCGKRRFFDEPKGTIETSERSGRFQNCTWSIKTPNRSNCLHITSTNKSLKYLKICNTTDYFGSLSIPANDVSINLEFTSDSFLGMSYTSYIVNCSLERLKCIPPRNFQRRKPHDACAGGMLKCNEMCSNPATACGDICYDVINQRCDRVLDCVYAADELGCNPKLCPYQIQCLNETKCLYQNQICDKKVDCKNGWDEYHCPKTYCEHGDGNCLMQKKDKNNNLTTTESIYLIAIVFALLAVLFLCMMFRCLAARRNVRNVLDNPLDIPLPPFRGPGETSSAGEDHPFTDKDFEPGGEIYESFVQNVNKIKSKRKNMLEIENDGITFVKPPPEKIVEKYFNGVEPVISEELAALATIKISREMCYGLRKTKSDEVNLTKLLFVDNIDDNLSEDNDNDHDGAGDWRKEFSKPTSKSDTDYVKKRRREFNIV